MAELLEEMFGDEPSVEPVAEPEPSPEPTAEPAVEPQPEPEVKPEPTQREPEHIPIAALLDERDRRKAAEKLAEQRQAELQRFQQRPEVPDPFDNPNDYTAYVDRQVQGALMQQKMDMSWTLAVRDHGQETTEAAKAWAVGKAENDPAFRQVLETEFARQALPIDWVVQQHKRDALLTDIGDPGKLDDWFEREAAKRGWTRQSATDPVAASAVAEQKPAAKTPPRSIASDTAAPARVTAESDKEGFLAAFR